MKIKITLVEQKGTCPCHRGHKVGDKVSVKVNETYSYDVIVQKIVKSDDENDKMRNY